MKRATLIIAVLFGAGGVAFVALQQKPDPGFRRTGPPAATAAAGLSKRAGPFVPPPQVSPGTRRPSGQPEVLHPTLRQVLPGVVAAGSDWRQFAPDRLTVSPIPGVSIEFAVKSVTSDGTRTIWTGLGGTPGVTLTSSGTRDRWDAIVTVPGALEYDVHIDASGVSVEKKDFAAEQCKPAGIAQNDLAAAQMLAAASQAPAVEAAPATTTYSVDLLVLYTTAAGTAMGGAAAVENNVAVRIASANQYLSQSQVDNVTWHVVGVVEAPGYTETGNLTTDLNNLASHGTAIGTFAAQQRDQFGADQVTLIVTSSTDGFSGIAYTPGAFSVSVRSSSAGVLAHELAHNFGCHHDRQQEKAPDNDGEYHYGYRYTDPTTRQDTGTIMSYANFRVPYYSNPNLTYQGHILGLAAGDPEAADNARVLRENAASIAALRPSAAVGAPMITVQPASVTVSAGQRFTLSVTATGGDLSYQWAHDGAMLAAATASSYTVNSAAAGDAGSYTVTVSNTAGSVQSSPAMVTVSSTPSTSPPPGGGTGTMGGGGGGGALDAATATLLLALLARLGRARWRAARAA